MAKQKDDGSYDGSQIQVLEGLDPVRKRPGMYIGSTGYDGVHHLIKEIADNSIDEAIAGFATRVDILILEDGGITITDDGRGIPVDKHPKTGLSTLETVLTILHAGGKFGGGGYKVSSGLHGVGSSVVNALSTKMIAEVVSHCFHDLVKEGLMQIEHSAVTGCSSEDSSQHIASAFVGWHTAVGDCETECTDMIGNHAMRHTCVLGIGYRGQLYDFFYNGHK